ncbi:putative arsenical pump membrane protein, ArsB [Helianthus annuus]|nr:putative arsenical pump membrane protein, ArsB [Helianthus annuus]
MAMAPTIKVVLGSIAFGVFWVLAVFPAVPFMPIGRTAGSLLGAMLMVLFQVLTPDQAYESIDLPILGLLFGTMVVLSVQKDEEEPPMEVTPEEDVNSHRFSPATMSHLTSENSHDLNAYHEAMNSHSLPSVSGHIDANTLRNRVLGSGDNEILKDVNGTKDVLENGSLQKNDEKVGSKTPSMNGFAKESSDLGLEDIDEKSAKWKLILWKIGVYVITVGMLVSFLAELNMSWTAITAAMALVVLDFKDARPCLEKFIMMYATAGARSDGMFLLCGGRDTSGVVSYSLLVFFCGMFVTVEGFNRTGIPSAIWDFMEPYAEIDKVSGVVVLAIVIVVLSNLASNVPTVLLLGSRVAAAAATISPEKEKKAWLILAWVSTVAGNLSLLGSAANLIVCEQARRAQHCGYNLTFWAHLKFGVPSTIIVTAIGLTLIRA